MEPVAIRSEAAAPPCDGQATLSLVSGSSTPTCQRAGPAGKIQRWTVRVMDEGGGPEERSLPGRLEEEREASRETEVGWYEGDRAIWIDRLINAPISLRVPSSIHDPHIAVHQFLRPFTFLPSVHLFIHPSVTHLSTHPPFIHPFVRPSSIRAAPTRHPPSPSICPLVAPSATSRRV